MSVSLFKWFSKSPTQAGLFGEEPAPPSKKPAMKMRGVTFGGKKEAPIIGAVKQEDGKSYIFLETTIGAPRWHTKEEALKLKAEGKLKPTSAEALKPEPKAEKEPSLKELMAVQSKVLKLAEIPEEDIPLYAHDSMADGTKLRSYSTEVFNGEMTAEDAGKKVKADYDKMKEGEEDYSKLTSKEALARARELGTKAYDAGLKVAFDDKELLKLRDAKESIGSDLGQAWNAAWMERRNETKSNPEKPTKAGKKIKAKDEKIGGNRENGP